MRRRQTADVRTAPAPGATRPSVDAVSKGDGPRKRPVVHRRVPWHAVPDAQGGYIMPSILGSQMDNGGQYVTRRRNTSMVSSHGQTATVSSVMPILVMPEAT